MAGRGALTAAVLIVFLPACVCIHRWQKAQTQLHREIELADVAKSWCQTIRASQVIPVYPLTEDLQPGDVFLVTRTIEDQAEEYKRAGFLPLDYHLVRLDPNGYGKFYSHSVLANDAVAPDGNETPSTVEEGRQDPPRIPAAWMRPGGELAAENSPLESWTTAPRAAFPSYSFATQAGAGFNLAVPVQGVPVGLGLLGNQAASGTITISESRTLGIDMASMWLQLRMTMAESASEFRSYAGTREKPTYVRTVTRIYLAGAMDVSISASSSAGGGLDVGAPRPVELLTKGPPQQGESQAATADQYASNIKAVNDMLAADNSQPGGSVRVTVAGGNTVGLRDTFDPPLVIGYLGFDCEILPGGVLGPPVPTLITLTDADLAKSLFETSYEAFAYDQAALADGLRLLRAALASGKLPRDLNDSGRAVADALDALGARVDGTMPTYMRELSQVNGTEVLALKAYGERQASREGEPYDQFKAYRSALEISLNQIDDVKSLGPFSVRVGGVLVDPTSSGHPKAVARVEADRDRTAAALERLSDLEAAAMHDLRAWLVRFWSARSGS